MFTVGGTSMLLRSVMHENSHLTALFFIIEKTSVANTILIEFSSYLTEENYETYVAIEKDIILLENYLHENVWVTSENFFVQETTANISIEPN